MSAPRPDIALLPGDVRCSDAAALLHTVLGSCIAVCLWDGQARVGGMNHFVLPDGPPGSGDSRYGTAAMPALLAEMERLGGHRQAMSAWIFGGAAVLPAGPGVTVGERNLQFARDWLARHGVHVVAERTGGERGRQVRFDTATGQAYMRHLAATGMAAA